MQCGLGTFLASVGGDNKFKLWGNNPRRANTPGRRFKCLFSQSPSDNVAFDAFGLIVKASDPYLALLSHTGLLSIMEPVELKTLSAWREMDSLYPFGQQSRSCEYSQSLSVKQIPKAQSGMSLDSSEYQDIVFLAVAMSSSLKILRAGKTGKHNFRIVEVLEVISDGTSINSIAWKPGSSQPKNVIALACGDGWGRLVEISSQVTSTEDKSNGPQIQHLSEKISFESHEVGYSAQEVAVLPHDDRWPLYKVQWVMNGILPTSNVAYD